MTKKEFDLKYRGSNKRVAVHCDTEEKAKAFLSLAKSFGYKFLSVDDSVVGSYWDDFKNKTCYVLKHNRIMYGRISTFIETYHSIVEFELDEPNGYAIEDTPSPIKETTKESNMKFKVGQKVRVRSDLVVGARYGGLIWYAHMENELSGKIFTIPDVSYSGKYILSETSYILSEEMLEPVTEETFKIGDVVYDLYGDKAKIVDTSFVITYENSSLRFVKRKNEITKEKPLKKITKEQLAEMGYEVEE